MSLVRGIVSKESTSWSTINRPINPIVGRSGFNTTLSVMEFWSGSVWKESENDKTIPFIIILNSGTGSDAKQPYEYLSGETVATFNKVFDIIIATDAPRYNIQLNTAPTLTNSYSVFNKVININCSLIITISNSLVFNNSDVTWTGSLSNPFRINSLLSYFNCSIAYYNISFEISDSHLFEKSDCLINNSNWIQNSDAAFIIKGKCEFIFEGTIDIFPTIGMESYAAFWSEEGGTLVIKQFGGSVFFDESDYTYRLTYDTDIVLSDVYFQGNFDVPEQPLTTGTRFWSQPLLSYATNAAARTGTLKNGHIYRNSITNALSIVVP